MFRFLFEKIRYLEVRMYMCVMLFVARYRYIIIMCDYTDHPDAYIKKFEDDDVTCATEKCLYPKRYYTLK